MNRRLKFSAILIMCLTGAKASALEIIDRAQPRALEPILQNQTSVPARVPPPQAAPVIIAPPPPPAKSSELDRRLADLLPKGDCEEILASLEPNRYEQASPESLAVLASCEPPGKDPEKMFAYAERQAPDNDAILLMHGRYRWKHQNADAEEIFLKLRNQTQNPRLRALANEYIVGEQAASVRPRSAFSYYFNAQIGGLQEGNPESLPSSDGQFGLNNSTAGTAQASGGVRLPYKTYVVGGDYVANDTTYWRTHDADLLTQDIDAVIEESFGETLTLGLRPYGSFYLLNGAKYYTLMGTGATAFWNHEVADQIFQAAYYRDNFAPQASQAESGSHYRFDWRLILKKFPTLQPSLLFFVDRANSGVDQTGSNYIPYSNTNYGVGISMDHVVHRYSVGLSVRGQWRKDDDSTRVLDGTGQYVSKRREDLRFLIRPNMTVPLGRGLDLYMYFESDSVSSSLRASDGLDRNVSDSVLGALLRYSFTNY